MYHNEDVPPLHMEEIKFNVRIQAQESDTAKNMISLKTRHNHLHPTNTDLRLSSIKTNKKEKVTVLNSAEKYPFTYEATNRQFIYKSSIA